MCVCERRRDIHLQMLMLAGLYNIESIRIDWHEEIYTWLKAVRLFEDFVRIRQPH